MERPICCPHVGSATWSHGLRSRVSWHLLVDMRGSTDVRERYGGLMGFFAVEGKGGAEAIRQQT